MSHTTKATHAARMRRDRVLLQRYHRTRDRRHRDELVEQFIPLARKVVRRYSHNPDTVDDLMQVAALGLVKAVERFDPFRGVAFSSYAVPTILGELKRYFRDHTWAVRPPRDLMERAQRVEQAMESFAAVHGRMPTVAQVATQLGGDEELVLEALHANRAATALSLDAAVGDDTLGDRIGCEDDEFSRVDERIVLDALLRMLRPRERSIIRMRFVDDMSQAQIGAAFGLSQMQISRIIRQAIERLQMVVEQSQATTASSSVGGHGTPIPAG